MADVQRPRGSHCPEGQRFRRSTKGRSVPVHTKALGTACRCQACISASIWTTERREAHAAVQRARPRHGAAPGTVRRLRPTDWRPAHDRLLRELLGQADLATIAEILTARFSRPRTLKAVRSRIAKLGLAPLHVRPWARCQLVRVLGVSDHHLTAWATAGLLVGVAWRLGGRRQQAVMTVAYPRAAIERFVRLYPHLVPWRGIRDGSLRTLAQGLQRGTAAEGRRRA